MLEVPESAGDAAVELDDPAHGLGPAVGRAVGVEVGQERCLLAAQCLAEPGDLGDRAGRQRSDQLLGQLTTPGRRGLVEHVSNLDVSSGW